VLEPQTSGLVVRRVLFRAVDGPAQGIRWCRCAPWMVVPHVKVAPGRRPFLSCCDDERRWFAEWRRWGALPPAAGLQMRLTCVTGWRRGCWATLARNLCVTHPICVP